MNLNTLSGQKEHYAAVRARLKAPPLRRQDPVLRRSLLPRSAFPTLRAAVLVEPPTAVVTVEATVPVLDMLTIPNSQFLISLAAFRHGLRVREILGTWKEDRLVKARHEAMALVYQHTDFSFPRIGRLFKRDHSTVIHALRKVGATNKLIDQEARDVR